MPEKKTIKLKYFILPLIYIFYSVFPCNSYSQTPVDILKNCKSKISSLQDYRLQCSGITFMPPMNLDTLYSEIYVYSKNMKDDTIVGINFFIEGSRTDCGKHYKYYNSKEFYSANAGIVKSPFSDNKIIPIVGSVGLDLFFRIKTFWIRNLLVQDEALKLMRLADTIINNKSAYHIKGVFINKQMISPYTCFLEKEGELKDRKGLRAELDLYISKNDYLPLMTKYKRIMDDDLEMFAERKVEFYEYNLNEGLIIPKDFMSYELVNEDISESEGADSSWSLSNFCLLNSDSSFVCLDSSETEKKLIIFSVKGCAPCIKMQSILNDFFREYDKSKISVYYITLFSGPSKLKEYKMKKKLNFEMLLGNKQLWRKCKIKGFPTLFLLDKDKKVLNMSIGFKTKEELFEFTGL